MVMVMVRQIQLTNEFYSDDDSDTVGIFDVPDYFDSDEQLVLIAVLLLLEQRFRLFQSMSSERIISEVDSLMESFRTELTDTALSKLNDYIYDEFINELNDWSIPVEGYVSLDYSINDILTQSIDNMITQLQGELKLKAMYNNMGLTDKSVDVKPNFNRASNKLKDAMADALIKGKEINHRRILEFVYGTSKLYRWFTVNDDKVCDWCLYQQSLPPRPLSEIPYDHNHGRCVLDPIDTTYSDEYYLLLARMLL